MTRGNQRDVDRARAAKRKEQAGGVTAKDKDGLTAAQRKERCLHLTYHVKCSNSRLLTTLRLCGTRPKCDACCSSA